jgi:hypothetical protein
MHFNSACTSRHLCMHVYYSTKFYLFLRWPHYKSIFCEATLCYGCAIFFTFMTSKMQQIKEADQLNHECIEVKDTQIYHN